MPSPLNYDSQARRPWRHHGLTNVQVTARWRRYRPLLAVLFLICALITLGSALVLTTFHPRRGIAGSAPLVFAIFVPLSMIFGLFALTAMFLSRPKKRVPSEPEPEPEQPANTPVITDGMLPRRPVTPEELVAMLAEASARGVQPHLIGSGSMPLARPKASRPIQPISTLRMKALVVHDTAAMTVTVHAGMSLGDLQRHLGWRNQWLPVDAPAPNGRSPMQRTLGGLIATDSLGPLRAGLGDWRTHLLAARYIDASGNLVTADASAAHALIGSGGRAGVIAEVTLRTAARPADEQGVVLYCPSKRHAANLLAAALAENLGPAYIELIGREGFERNILQLPMPPQGFQLLAIGFLGDPDRCAADVARARALPAAADLESICQTLAQSGRLRLWMTSEPAGEAAFRLALAPSQVASVIAAIEHISAENRIRVFLVAEAATALLRGSFSAAPAPAIAALRKLANSLAVSLVFTHGGPSE